VHGLIGVLGVALMLTVLWDAFETVVLPRRVTRSFRLARFFYRTLWSVWTACVRVFHSTKTREMFLSVFGPLSLLLLLATWAMLLILAFAMVFWAFQNPISDQVAFFRGDLYFSGTTFFTLGLVTPATTLGRIMAVGEAGTGLGFLAVMIAYLPTLYGSLSEREVNISLLDARAGSPPTAGELLRRHGRQRVEQDGLADYLREWEIGSAQLMETHLTYPFLCFFRSQHDNQSWLAAFTAILDVCALLIAYGEGETKWQAQLTFAISRHAVADLAEVFHLRPHPPREDRLPPEDLPKVRSLLVECIGPSCAEAGDQKLQELRSMYEPYISVLSRLLWMPLPPWGVTPVGPHKPTLWERITSTGGAALGGEIEHRHF
jgi:hypothetical protein